MTLNQYEYFVILLLPFSTKAHKTTHTNMLWEGYYNTTNFNRNWSLSGDAQIRTRDWTKQWSQIWRPWQEFSYQLKGHKINFIQRLRAEQWFLQQVINNEKTKDYLYVFRLQYSFEFQMPLQKNNISILAGNEALVNPEYLNNSLFFNQNRTFAGVNCKFSSNSTFQFQYVKIFQWGSNTSVLDDQNVFRINLIQQFNFRKSYDSK